MSEKREKKNKPVIIMPADEVIRYASINILLICEKMGEIDPNENYTLWLGFVDQFVTVAEVLKTVWDQRRGSLMLMPIRMPDGVVPVEMSKEEWSKAEQMDDLFSAIHKLRDEGFDDSISSELPF